MRRLLAALVLVLVACRRETTAPAHPALAPTTPQEGGRLVQRLESRVETLNYILHSQEEERQVLAYIYEPLIALDQNLSPIPGIATKWEISDGGRTYTLHLDPRATFSDGTPVKASDVIFTIAKMVDENSPQFSGWFEGLDRAQSKALDEHTARVTFAQARVAQLLAFNISVVPEHIYAKGELSKIKRVVGPGAYVVKKFEPGKNVLVERRTDYWRAKPRIQSVLFRPIADEKAAWHAMRRGQIDVAHVTNDIWFREKDDAEVQRRINFHNVWLLSYNFIVWNLDDPLFNDARVRRAMAMTFDRRAVIDKLYHGQARPVSGPFTPDHWANNEEVVAIEFNLPAASALLASAGWRDTDGDGTLDRAGKKFEFTLEIPAESPPARDQSQILQDALRQIGVRMEISSMEGAAFLDRVLKRNFQAAFLAWTNDPDPDPFSNFHSTQKAPEGSNLAGYANAEADELIVQARGEFDPARRADIYHQLHEVLARDQPYLWTVQVASKWAVNKRVQNVHVSRGLGLFLWYPGPFGWWLSDAKAATK